MSLSDLKERLEKVAKGGYTTPYQALIELREICDAAIQWAEAYRIVAIGWVTSEMETKERTKSDCVSWVDEDACKLVTSSASEGRAKGAVR